LIGRLVGRRVLTGTFGTLAAIGCLALPGVAAGSAKPTTPNAANAALRPVRPTHLRTTLRASGAYLTWAGHAKRGFTVTRAANRAMNSKVHTYTILGGTRQFTPPGLVRGRTYFFQVRARGRGARSAASALTEVRERSAEQNIRVMTYNIEELSRDGQREGTGVVAPWSKRRIAAARLIKKADPDVVAIQEGSTWVGRPRGRRQVDSLKSALGGGYALSHTEVSPNRPHYFRTGDYILYRKSAYRAVGHSWHWALGDTEYAAYQVLVNRQTHAKLLFVSTHLIVGDGAGYDRMRERETKVLLSKAGTYAARRHIPVIYAGDFNTDHTPEHAFDGPGIAMREAHVASAFNAAQARWLAKYNSANGYDRRPPKFGDHIDYVFAPPGVAVRSWAQVMDLRHGRLRGVIPSDHNPVVATLEYPY
jgi:endonuclease/exonuclease/phosphatase family metal-dependent hydrolase